MHYAEIEKLSHAIGTAPVLEIKRAYGLRPRGFCWWRSLVVDEEWGENEQRLGRGSRRNKMAVVFHTV